MKRLILLRLLLSGLVLLISAAPAVAEKRGVRVDGKDPVDYVAAQYGQSWAVVIGINDYEQVPRLHYAVEDARAVAALLKQQGYQVTELFDRDATRRNILRELQDRLVERVGEQDRVLIYYAGHGETKTVKGGKTMGYLLPVNGEADALGETAISMTMIRDLADALPSKHVLFLIDSCYGGVAGTQFRGLPKYSEEYLREITRERGRQLITAGGPTEQALEGPEWGHSVFTYYLLEGLGKGLADLNEDGIVPASELYAYLDTHVFQAAQMKNHRQRPLRWNLAAENGEFVFFTSTQFGHSPPGRLDVNPSAPGPSAALIQKQRELAALEEEARRAEEETKQAELDRQIAEKRQQLEEQRKKKLDVASLPTPSAPKQYGREITGRDGAPMVLVPAGEFTMGSDDGDSDEKPVRRISLDAFYMDKYEVTTKLYAGFMQTTGRKEPKHWTEVRLVSQGDRPVVGVTWHDADAYCRQYGKRLPTEQEWEKAARGTDGRTYPWGHEKPSGRLANTGAGWCGWFCNVYEEKLTPVGNYEAGKSPYGIYDLAGNVWEWTSSDYDSSHKVFRGGSWYGNALSVRSSVRSVGDPAYTTNNRGFRCAQDAS